MKTKYNIGQKITLNKDIELKSPLTGNIKNLKEGTRAWFTASDGNPSLCLEGGKYILLDKDCFQPIGYDTEGLASYLYYYLETCFPIQQMLDEYEVSPKDFEEFIAEGLKELDMFAGEIE